MSDIKALLAIAQEAGLTGESLAAFLREERAAAREAAAAEREREEKEKEREEKERERQEREKERQAIAEENEKQRLHELALAQARAQSDPTAANSKPGKLSFKMPPFDDKKDDMDAYITRFEQYCTVHEYKQETWACNLSVQLRGNALAVYHRMSPDDQQDYSKLKSTLLRAYQLTEAGYRDKFREAKPLDDEEFTQFVTRLSNYMDRWIELGETEKTFAALRDLVVKDQVLQVCHSGLRGFIQERKPKDLQELKDYGITYLDANGRSSLQWTSAPRGNTRHQKSTPGKKPLTSSSVSVVEGRSRTEHPRSAGKEGGGRKCWICDSSTHIAKDCTKRSNKNQGGKSTAFQCRSLTPLYADDEKQLQVFRDEEGNVYSTRTVEKMAFEALRLEGLPVQVGRIKGHSHDVEVLRDTGCTGTVVRQSLCRPEDFTGEKQACILMDGSIVEHPQVITHVDTPYFTGEIQAVAMENPVYDVVIGNIPGARRADDPDQDWTPAKTEVLGAVTTRAQKKAKPLPPLKVTKSPVMGTTREELRKMQSEDKSLQKIREWIADGRGENPRENCDEKYYWDEKTKLLMREYVSTEKMGSQVFNQVVLPEKLRLGVLEVAHDSILGGHLGTRKTTDRVLSNFYWPGLHGDVVRYCQSCDICQRTVPKGRTGKAPLGTMPITGVPFTRVAMDLIGPLPVSRGGHRWVLTLVCCATRYPEAVPLRGIETKDIAEELVGIFSRVGVPKEILTDRGTQFTSDLMSEVARLLSLRQLFTTPYHAMCNGQCERFNGTLKSMMKKMSAENPRDWDRYIPALLFAYREVPQQSTGFSPFEMLYGRTVRGPMSILRELWTEEEQQEEVRTTYQYVLELRERLEETCRLAHEELRRTQVMQKKRYDQGKKFKKLKPGDKVLLLLPTESGKLLMQWKGPFEVVRQTRESDFVININGKEKTFHANMLKKYHERTPPVTAGAVVVCQGSLQVEVARSAEEVPVSMEEDDSDVMSYPMERTQTWRDVQLAPTLSDLQKKEAEELLRTFDDVLTDLPGKTRLEECDIELVDNENFRIKSYPVPYALAEEMDKEVSEMLRLGVIEPSNSSYVNPSVVVRKPDGKIRYCLDFRRLNSKTVFDAEPVPNQEEILNKVGRAMYITKMDLTKGFWQIPIKEEDRHLTAFQTSQGLMQFRVMPFGLVNALQKFCRMVRKLLKDIKDAESYVDDLFVLTMPMDADLAWRAHLESLREVLQALRENNLTAKPSKCVVGAQETDALGHMVGKGFQWPQPGKIEKILEITRPVTKSDVRSFLGMVGFYRKYIPNFAGLAKPLTDKTRKGEPAKVKWNETSEKAFQALKDAMSSKPILRLPDQGKQFILTTDASQTGIGAVLKQEADGVCWPVMYISRKLKPAESRYSTIERECLGLVWATKRLHVYLYGREFILETDHQPLLFLDKSKINNDRVMRWALTMQVYRYSVRVIKGKDNATADYLSRCGNSEV